MNWLERDETALAAVLPRCTSLVAVEGRGVYLEDVKGDRYLDFTSGIATNSTGHCHPRVVEAIKLQAETLIHTSVVTHNTLNIRLAERLGELCPFFSSPQVFFSNSGAEAVDGALKMARRVTNRPGIIAFEGAFHGRTLGATSITTAKVKYQEGYRPFPPGIAIAPYGAGIKKLKRILDRKDFQGKRHSHEYGAMIVEPVLGEGGYVVPSREWLQELRAIATEYGLLLIFDEVQTGIGRTGYPFAAETFGVTPDVLLFAKGVASGMPLGGIIAEKTLLDRWPVGTHGSTFGGNPVSCAAGLATLDVLTNCYENVREFGTYSKERLTTSISYPVRGVGLMIGIELPDEWFAKAVQNECINRGLLVITCGPGDNVLRLMPPLTVSFQELQRGLTLLIDAINGVQYVL